MSDIAQGPKSAAKSRQLQRAQWRCHFHHDGELFTVAQGISQRNG
jgi:hypothetical protein